MKMNKTEKERLIKISKELKEYSELVAKAVNEEIDIKRSSKKYGGLQFIDFMIGGVYGVLRKLETGLKDSGNPEYYTYH